MKTKAIFSGDFLRIIVAGCHVFAPDDSQEGRQGDWSSVENKRARSGRVLQRLVLVLGEINSSQELAWRKSIEVLEPIGRKRWRWFQKIACFGVLPDTSDNAAASCGGVRLCRPRQWGARWQVT